MSAIVVTSGEEYWLDKVNSFAVGDSWTLGLFQNNYTVLRTSAYADLTACTFTGYAALTTGAFAASTLDGSNRAVASPSSNTFTFTRSSTGSPQTAYGWYLFKGTTLIMAENFSSPFTFTSSGDALTLTLQDRLASDT